MCECKESLYRNLLLIKRTSTAEDGLSYEYVSCVDAIKEHIRSGHDGEPCPDGAY
jgi:hypothetical protein